MESTIWHICGGYKVDSSVRDVIKFVSIIRLNKIEFFYSSAF
jgi:hypothetical protein